MRTKKVFSDISKVAHLWANQLQDSARNSGNFYFEGDTIYSYGRHFPIAIIARKPTEIEPICLFTLRTYSVTTAQHINVVGRANHRKTIFMYDLPASNSGLLNECHFTGAVTGLHEGNLKYWESKLKTAFDKLSRARIKENYINEIGRTIGQMNEYITFFGIVIDSTLQALISNANPEQFKEYLESEKQRIEANSKRIAAAKKKADQKEIRNWRAFKTQRMYGGYQFDILRYNKAKNRVETSQAVEIPAAIAKTFYAHVKAVINTGGCTGNCVGKFMEQYEIKEINAKFIHIGCHKIELKEIERIYKLL